MANYNIGQQNYISGTADESFANYIDNGTVEQQVNQSDQGGTGNINFVFSNPYLYIPGNSKLKVGTNYYFHAKVARKTAVQNYNIRLINTENPDLRQWLRALEVNPAVDDGTDNLSNYFMDVEFVFSPLDTFDGILFELGRDKADLDYQDDQGRITGRIPAIAFLELSIVNNKMPELPEGVTTLPKIGVRSHPGLMLCINGEEIHISRSGIFELRDGIVPISFFSVVGGGAPISSYLDDWMLIAKSDESIGSICFIDSNSYGKKRTIDNFTLDYLYRY